MLFSKTLSSIDPLTRKSAMGPVLRDVVETQLARDLRNYRIYNEHVKFDWSQSYGGGRSFAYLDGKVENFNRVIVFDQDNNLLADGCIDFIANRFFFLAYWDLVTTWKNGDIVKEKKDHGMPISVWRQLPEALMAKHQPHKP